MSVIWEVNVSLMRHPESEFIRVLHGSTVRKYDTEEAAQAAYVDAIKQLGGKQ